MAAGTQEALAELLQFLTPGASNDLKVAALKYITGLTANDSGCSLIANADELLQCLVTLSIEDNETVRHECLRIFINILHDPDKASSYGLLNDRFLSFLVKYVLNKSSGSADDAAKLLSNLTRSESNCLKVLQAIDSQDDVSLPDFVDAFCIRDYNTQADLSHLGSFLSNMTALENVRKSFLDKERCVIQRILPYTVNLESSTRRAAAARILRNISFETDHHEWLISKDVDIVSHLLLPLAGPEELPDDEMEQLPLDLQYLPSDKQREPNNDIKQMLLETLLQLCSRKPGRMYLKYCGAYIVVRELHIREDNEKVCMTLEKLIQILIGDEPESNMENLKEVEIPLNIKENLEKLDVADPSS